MKKIILPIIIPLLFGGGVLAQAAELPSPGLTPDSPFYFFDTLGEKIGMFFTFGAERKAEKAMKYAEEKLAEAKAMAEKNKIKAIERANQKYQDFLGLANRKAQEAKEEGKDVDSLVTLISEKTLKHQEVLLEVYEKVAEQAKTAVEKAIEISKRGFETAVKAVSGAKKEELQQKAEEMKIRIEEKIKKAIPEIKKPEIEKPLIEAEPKLTPQEALKKWYEGVVNEEWDWVFENTVNVDGKPYSEQCKRKIKEMLGNWAGATYSLEVAPITRGCAGTIFTPGVTQPEIQNLERLGCKAVEYSLDMETIGAGKFSFSGAYHWVIPQEGKWKVVWLCREVIEKPAPEIKKEVWPTEPKQKALASCQKIKNPSLKEKCINIIEKNSAKCKDASCYLYVAVQTKDSLICDKISEETASERYLKLLCKAVVNEDVTQCEMERELGMYGGHECNLWLALKKNNSNLCDSALCKALVEKDPKFCLQGKWHEEECYFYLAAFTQNADLCNALNGNELVGERAACIKVVNRDLSEIDCEISRGRQYDICNSVAILNEDPSICKRLPYGGSYCYEGVAYTLARIFPKTYAFYKEISSVPSIKTIAKTCAEIGGEIISPTQGCAGTMVETIDTTLCCIKTKGIYILSDIDLLKKSFKPEEAPRAVKCTVYSFGEDFDGVIVYIIKKEGKIVEVYREIGRPMGRTSGSCVFGLPPGSYFIQMAVFKCVQIEEKFNISCEDAEPRQIIEKLQPLHLSSEEEFNIIE